MAKKVESPVYAAAPLHEKESRWQCATCRGYLAFSLPIDLKAMGQLLQAFSRAHARCAPGPGQVAPPGPAGPPTEKSNRKRTPRARPQEPSATAGMSFDPNGPTAKAQARREALLALPRDHTPAERRELTRLEAKLTEAGVLTISTTF